MFALFTKLIDYFMPSDESKSSDKSLQNNILEDAEQIAKFKGSNLLDGLTTLSGITENSKTEICDGIDVLAEEKRNIYNKIGQIEAYSTATALTNIALEQNGSRYLPYIMANKMEQMAFPPVDCEELAGAKKILLEAINDKTPEYHFKEASDKPLENKPVGFQR